MSDRHCAGQLGRGGQGLGGGQADIGAAVRVVGGRAGQQAGGVEANAQLAEPEVAAIGSVPGTTWVVD